MSVDQQLIGQMVEMEQQLERLESQEQRRLITDYAWLRGWHDDFLGDALADQYEPRTDALGVGSYVALVDGAHGGVVRIYAGAAANAYGRLMLGEQTDLYDSLDPDDGFLIIARYRVSSTANILGDLFVNAPAWNHIHIVADSTVGPNWMLRNDNNSGVDNWANSGVAFNAAWHWHMLEARSGYAAHWLDNVLINETTTKVPTVPMTPDIRCLARAAASKYLDLDYWTVKPG